MSLYGVSFKEFASTYDIFKQVKKVERIQKINKLQPSYLDEKLTRIINKFSAGNRLTKDELSYLVERSPMHYQKVVRVMKERERLESRLTAARDQVEVDDVAIQAVNGINSLRVQDHFMNTARINQYRSAQNEYKQKLDDNQNK